MGIIIKQAATSSIYSYIGALLGFFNVTILMNRWFTTDEFGLREIILNIAVIFAQLAGLGTSSSLVKFFPFFNKEGKKDYGLLSIGSFVSLIGFTIFSFILFLSKDLITKEFNDGSTLFASYFELLFPLSFLLLFNQVLENYIKARSRIALTTFLKEVFHRIIVFVLLIIFHQKIISYDLFIKSFVFSYGAIIIIYIIHLYHKREIFLKVNFKYFPKRFQKVYFNYSLFSILSGFSNLLIGKVDIIMVGFALGLTGAAIYSNAAYLSVLIYIPAVAITKIASPIIAREFKSRRLNEIETLYKKSSTSQLLIGGLIFILLWSSIDNFYEIQREEYKAGKWVLFLLGGSRVITMLFGLAGPILHISRYYRFDTITSIILAIITIITNSIFIPLYGMEGAAFATMISLSLFYFFRYRFIKSRLGIQPFTKDTLLVGFILLVGFCVGQLLPSIDNIYLDTIFRSVIILIFVVIPTIYLNLVEDLNRIFNNLLKKINF